MSRIEDRGFKRVFLKKKFFFGTSKTSDYNICGIIYVKYTFNALFSLRSTSRCECFAFFLSAFECSFNVLFA